MRRVAALTLLVAVAFVATALAIQSDLPTQVATHWSGRGAPDGFTSREHAWLTVAVPVGVVALLLAPLSAVVARSFGDEARWMLGLPVATATMTGTITLGSLWLQRGLTNATEMALPGWLMPVGLVTGGVVGWAGVQLAGRSTGPPTTSAGAPADAPRTQLPDGAVLWRGTTPRSSALQVAAGIVAVVGLVTAAVVSWWLLLLFVPLVALLLSSAQFNVAVGAGGAVASGTLLGWPRVTVPLDTVTAAEPVTTRFVDFGGWGIRLSTSLDSLGVVPRHGPAVQLRRTIESSVLISLDNPDEVAGIVNSLLDRRTETAVDPSVTDRPR